MFNNIYRNKKVLVTGHTGFKGSWLALWLLELGADVVGYSLKPDTEPNHFNLIKPDMNSIFGDVRNFENVLKTVKRQKPDIVFHLAAQPIVRRSYIEPVETLTTNVMGTVNVLESARTTNTVRAFINVTSDKCYDNKELNRGYRETDPLGGYDPYSASKGCSEIITNCWRSSFFNPKDYDHHGLLLASARAGNVIGGGDWAEDRLIPDIMRAATSDRELVIRNPNAIRAWQHVLEPLSGYLVLGQRLLERNTECAGAWNFGPLDEGNITVSRLVGEIHRIWPKVVYREDECVDQPHEANLLLLDSSKARSELQWSPVFGTNEMVTETVMWYRSFYESGELKSHINLHAYVNKAQSKMISWALDEIS